MKFFWLVFAGLLALRPAATLSEGASSVSRIPVVLGVQVDPHPGFTRVVLELSDPVELRTFALDRPKRVVFRFPKVLWRLPPRSSKEIRGAIQTYRYGQFRNGESRFVLDIDQPLIARPPLILPPSNGMGYRIVVDLYPVSEAQFAQSAGWPADLEGHHPRSEITGLRGSEGPLLQKVIVVDPGHGGPDGGTTGVNGSHEKDLVLDMARRLAGVLTRRHYVVHLTRNADTYIPLRQRVKMAHALGADLLISLHADSNPNQRMAGASVYTLSEQGSDREAAALARKENQSDAMAGIDLKDQEPAVTHILLDFAQRETVNRSERFADRLVAQLGRATHMISRDPHRSAAFAVLKGPDVPAVLIELGYLSNDADCAQMARSAWRDSVVSEIARAVDVQFAPEFAGNSPRRASSSINAR